ncbi:hypothetical protein MKX03_021146 [Papaver bracteatum]|nr:hypothetical protein MKX03_021146 [Papaver bracteatum]
MYLLFCFIDFLICCGVGGLRIPKQHPSPPTTTIASFEIETCDSSADEDDGNSEVDGSHDVKLKDERRSGCFVLGQGSGVHTEIHQLVGPDENNSDLEKPLELDDFNSASEIQYGSLVVFMA